MSPVQPTMGNRAVKKQDILTIDKQFTDNIRCLGVGCTYLPEGFGQFLADAEPYIMLRQRQFLEDNDMNRQIIPIVAFVEQAKNEDEEPKFLIFQRTPMGGEARLFGKHTTMFGGHIDAKDVIYDALSVKDVEATVKGAIVREVMNEEIIVEKDGERLELDIVNCKPIGLLIEDNPSNNDKVAVGKVHLGLFYIYVLPEGCTFRSDDADISVVGLKTPRELEEEGCYDLEPWAAYGIHAATSILYAQRHLRMPR